MRSVYATEELTREFVVSIQSLCTLKNEWRVMKMAVDWCVALDCDMVSFERVDRNMMMVDDCMCGVCV